MRLAEIERGRAHQIADVLDQEQAVVGEVELRKRVRNHLRVEMAAFSGVDLHRPRAGLAYAIGIARCLLVALDDRDGRSSLPRADRLHEQRRLSGSRARNQVQRKYTVVRQCGAGSRLRSHRSWRADRARPGRCVTQDWCRRGLSMDPARHAPARHPCLTPVSMAVPSAVRMPVELGIVVHPGGMGVGVNSFRCPMHARAGISRRPTAGSKRPPLQGANRRVPELPCPRSVFANRHSHKLCTSCFSSNRSWWRARPRALTQPRFPAPASRRLAKC